MRANYFVRPVLAFVLVVLLASCGGLRRSRPGRYIPQKREFRGAWIPTIYRSEYSKLSRIEARELLTKRLALLQRMGCNAVLFQVRAESDAWYRSDYEPWSKYLSGEQGLMPEDGWDPLAFVVDECHKRGMELHAWINPLRGAANANDFLAENHPVRRYPDWFVRYGNQLVLDPGLPQARRYVCKIVEDITKRYDIDAIHLDDYFYPYPIPGTRFPDDQSFERHGLSAGYHPGDRATWRRNNINLLVYELSQTIRAAKPWVRFGVSPFGIYRNKRTHPKGSMTTGLQNYDDLYADVLHWANEDWIDYVAPQIYWNEGTKGSDYQVLVKWWSKHLRNERVQLYIGQDIKRTMDAGQLERKLLLSQRLSQGNIFWPADELIRNYGGVGEELHHTYQHSRALMPEQRGFLGQSKPPKIPASLWEDHNEAGHVLIWEDERDPQDPESAFYYGVYAFPKGEEVNLNNPKALVGISTSTYYKLPSLDGATRYTFLVTAINRFWLESEPRKIRVVI